MNYYIYYPQQMNKAIKMMKLITLGSVSESNKFTNGFE